MNIAIILICVIAYIGVCALVTKVIPGFSGINDDFSDGGEDESDCNHEWKDGNSLSDIYCTKCPARRKVRAM